jgi:hypothetical protein
MYWLLFFVINIPECNSSFFRRLYQDVLIHAELGADDIAQLMPSIFVTSWQIVFRADILQEN